MKSIGDRLPGFALPFVTRSLRGGRGKRFVALSFGLALLTALTCLWIGLGRGETARQMRVDLGMEQPIYEREHQEFVIIQRPGTDHDAVLESRKPMMIDGGRMTVREAIGQVAPPEHAELQARAKELASQWVPVDEADRGFSWHDARQVYRLAKIVEREGIPAVVEYTPVVDLRGALQLLAIITGGMLVLLFTVVAPLLVALQQASERHENTLQPLTGTALGARELMIGLACGPLAIVAIFAAPLAALYVLAVVGVGPLASLALLPVLAGTSIGLVFGAQLLAHLIGARRAPGLIAVGLLMLLGLVGMIGFAIACEFELDILGIAALVPHSGMFALLGDCFGEPWRVARVTHYLPSPNPHLRPTLEDFLAPMLIGTLGAAMLGLLALRALTRHVEGRDTLLEFGHATFGALICIVMVDVAIPALEYGVPIHQAFGLPALSVPFLLLILARVPIGDVPTKLRRIPLPRLLAEFACWTMVHLVVAAAIDGTIAGFHPVTMVGVGWCVLVLVLLAARLAATPGRILAHAWALVCLGMLPFTYVLSTVWAFEPGGGMKEVSDLSVMVAIWLGLVVWVPISLVRHLRKHVARIA